MVLDIILCLCLVAAVIAGVALAVWIAVVYAAAAVEIVTGKPMARVIMDWIQNWENRGIRK